ncbi:MAG: hypothetical protein K6F33_13360 [Bacteroidales bacterium]|nr:hypothetical protein [Bacteroidales bacterium]
MAELHISTPEEMADMVEQQEVKDWLLGPPFSLEEARELAVKHLNLCPQRGFDFSATF